MNLEYVGGLFDGEGSVSILLAMRKKRKTPCHTLACNLTITHKPTVDFMKERFGGKSVVLKPPAGKEYRKVCWQWSVGNKKAAAFLKIIEPYLYIKSAQAALGIQFQKRMAPRDFISQDEVDIRECFRQAMWKLNGLASMGRSSNKHRTIPTVDTNHWVFKETDRLVKTNLIRISSAILSSSYIAGLFDAEGNVSVLVGKSSKKNGTMSHLLHVQITSGCQSILMAVQRTFRGAVKLGHSARKNASASWNWGMAGGTALQFLKTIYPFLRARKNQTELGIRFQETKKHYKKTPQEELDIRESFRQAIWKLNGPSSRGRTHNKHREIPIVPENHPLLLWVDEQLQKNT